MVILDSLSGYLPTDPVLHTDIVEGRRGEELLPMTQKGHRVTEPQKWNNVIVMEK